MSDKTKVVELLRPIKEYLDSKKKELMEVDTLVAKNQNSPPLGDADGSFTEKEWLGARDSFHAAHSFLHSYNRLTNVE